MEQGDMPQEQSYAANTDHGKFLVVGIGASAGGIQALKEFFENVPDGSGIAYVVILHLSPNHDSQLAGVLQFSAKIPVTQVTEKVLVQPDHVYVIPPNQHLMMQDGNLAVMPNTQIEDRRAPVDIFFRTLAESHGARAVCVVLSGTGANGSMGLKRVKERGGAVFVQNPREAEFNEMPRNAIATELVDDVLPVAQIPGKIIAYKESLGILHIPVEAEQRPEVLQQALREIFTQLRIRTGHDFSNYKRPTILRRIERRINIHNLPDLPAYTAYIQQHPEEVHALLKDLLISVTNFYRDKKAFEALERDVIANIFADKRGEDQVRIWIAGCATGEEAYSIAMLCAERTMGLIDAPKVQLFATDIDETAIGNAREGFYTLNDAADVSPERLNRFFSKEGDGYRIRREIREMILFANHNFIKDPPFSHLDLVTCRNVLIYLNHTAQERVMETFHFALDPGGYLFLGTSESADSASDLYSVFNREQHIYQSRMTMARSFPVPESVPNLRQEASYKLQLAEDTPARTSERITFGDMHQRMLEQYAPPSLVVNEEYDIVHVSDRAGQYLQVSGGEVSQNLLKMIRPELRLELRSALYQATQQQTPVEARHLSFTGASGGLETINIIVRPVLHDGDIARGFILVVFEQATDETAEKTARYTSDEPVARQLEDELMRLKAQLRTSNEQHEFQAEELRASNEELQAMNEELRSAAEELETGKEELQSINEELITVNQELKIKVEEVSMSSNNLQNLINSTDIGTIFLDRSLRVVLFTPAASSIFNLIAADHGRSLSDITHRLSYGNIMLDAEAVLSKLQTVERELQTTDGRQFLMRAVPYRTVEDRINGVVISFVDITSRKAAEEELRKNSYRLTQSMAALKAGWGDWDWITGKAAWSEDGMRIMGFISDEEAATAQGWLARIHPGDRARVEAISAEAAKTHTPINMEYRVVHHDGSIHYVLGTGMLTYNDEGVPVASTGLVIDISERKRSEEALRESEARLAAFLEQLPVGIGLADMNGRWVLTNPMMAHFGFKEVIPSRDKDGIKQWRTWDAHGKLVHASEWPGAKGLRGETEPGADFLYTEENGEERWTRVSSVPFLNTEGEVTGAINIIQDINAHKLAEKALRESEERLRITMESVSDYAIITTDAQNNITGWSGGAESIFGYTADEAIGQSYKLIFTPEDIGEGIPEKELEQAEAQGRASDERWHIRKDGSRFFMMGVVAVMRSGTHSGYVKVAQDMTDQKNAEEALRISEERYRIALQSADMGAWDWDLINDTTLWNAQHYTLLGLDAPKTEEPKSSDFFVRFVHPDDVAAVTEALRQAIEETGIYRMDAFRITRPDGEVRWMSGYGRAVEQRAGKAARMVGVMYDITTRIEAAIALRDKQLKLEIAQRAARVGIWGYDLVKNQGIATPELIELTGYPNAGETWELDVFLKLVHPADRPLLVAAFKSVAEDKAGIELEFRLQLAESDTLWMLMRGSYIPPYDRMNATLMGSIIDITERKRLEQQKDEFIGIASHELKTPVTSIKAYAEVLQEMFEDVEDNYSASLMSKLDAQVDRLNGLIHALLDTTRISEGELKLQPERFDLNELVEAHAEELQRTTKNHRLVVMPGVAAPIMADRERIIQVLTNLISNAIKYSPAGGDVIIAITRVEDGVQVSVRDCGIGISAEILEKIFERFYRVRSVQTNTFPGLGLGLYIAAQIVRRHGGTIGVKSAPGEGSAFYFTLPSDNIQS